MSQDRKTRRSKRRQHQPVEDEEVVDDLAYAATFAMMGPLDSEPATEDEPNKEKLPVDSMGNDDEIEIEDEETEEESKCPSDIPEKEEEEEGDDIDDGDDNDDDDGSELNIADMEDEIDEMNDTTGDSNAVPKTKHEVDAYKIPIQELEQHMQVHLSIENSKRIFDSSNLTCAGTVKHYMVQDRTVVVESNPPVRGNSISPLDEGSLLVFQDLSSNSLVPLGKVFEVFGPVSQPLYTIRLPTPQPPPQEPKSDSTNSSPKAEEEVKTADESHVSDQTEATTSKPSSPSNVEHEDSKDDSPASTAVPITDHWAPNGKYSLLLSQSSSINVFFVKEEAKLLDTGSILRKSGKGCDASNIYDEEVGNGDVMYYSDDEKEREAKSRRKPSRQQQQGRQEGRPTAMPSGFHQPPPSGFHRPLSFGTQKTTRSPPQGFHNPLAQPQQSNQTQPAYPYPYPQRASGSQMPPQPPPPRGGGPDQPPAYPAPYQY
eukprot:scaffold1807_cov140-Cylindrotheca_fusiformis.AAC.15